MNEMPMLYTNEGEVALPCRWEVCRRCRGEGELAMPGVSFSSDEMEELGEDFCDDYMNGVYNEPCPECGGRTTVAVVDEERMDPELLAAWQAQQRSMWEMYEVERQERMMGA
jgi:hypothetical protein